MTVKYSGTYRRSLLDMHIPDWDSQFLSKYDPVALAQQYKNANVDGVLLYCKSHMGLNYWPAPVGGIHPAAKTRDLVGELVVELNKLNIRPAAYHSVMYDNWAAENHPDWRIQSASTLTGDKNRIALGARYATCCPNNPNYLEYEKLQITSLISRYEFDALWIDMVFWTAICVCKFCVDRLKSEEGIEIPTEVNWSSPDWSKFQNARIRWLDDFWEQIRTSVKDLQPDLAITHNFASTLGSWWNASTTHESSLDDFTGGDLYGGKNEQLIVSKMMHHISRVQPAEYMSSRTPDLRYHVQLRTERDILIQALGATANHLAFLFIDAIDPVGTVSNGVYERMGKVFAVTSKFEEFLGGVPVEDVAVYFSDHSKMSPAENGMKIWELPEKPSHHLAAFHGACRTLQAEHIPFGIITKSQLSILSQFKVLVLPDVTRMDMDEITLIKDFVKNGGRVYASGGTSLMDTTGKYGPDFGLAEILGIKLVEDREKGGLIFMKPTEPKIIKAVSPEEYVSWGLTPHMDLKELAPVNQIHIPRIKSLSDTQVLATLTLPYAYPEPGTFENHKFASIHSSPPWDDTSIAAITKNTHKRGQAIYTVAPIEKSPDAASLELFSTLIWDLLDNSASLMVTAPEQVWVTAFTQSDKNRTIISVLNYDEKEIDLIARVSIKFRFAKNLKVKDVRNAETGLVMDCTIREGEVEFPTSLIETFEMYIINYQS